MDTNEIQKRLNALSGAMLAKGLVQPKSSVWFDSHVDPKVSLHWEDMTKPEHSYRTVAQFFRKGDLAQKFDDADAWVAALPTADEAKLCRREEACPGHESESTASAGHDHRRGWHPARCKHCGLDMSVDSGA